MKGIFTHKASTPPETILMPLFKGDYLAAVLEKVGLSTNIDANLFQREFDGSQGEIMPIFTERGRLFLLGLGEQPGFADILKVFRSFSNKYKTRIDRDVAIDLRYLPEGEDPIQTLEAATNGLRLGTYNIGRFKSEDGQAAAHPLEDEQATLTILLEERHLSDAPYAFRRGLNIAETQLSIFNLVNAPSNKKNPIDLARWAQESGKKHGYRVEVFDKKKIEEKGLHALLAVNRGSEHDPAFIIMEYRPDKLPAGTAKVGLVGKGVTFDTGGLSIKPSTNMHLMKSDMGGAAAVFGAMEAAAKLKLPVHLIGIVPSTDNSVDAKSIKPSDVIDSYSSKTIEIIDTDAEGRLILADGLSYMIRNYQPEILIDLATLTGSAVRTFGYHAAGLFANNDDLARQLIEAGENTGERIWQLPIWDVYKEDIKSDVADVRNYSGRPTAGAIGAAKFLEVFIEDHPAWAHLDIAGVAFSDSEFSLQKSSTAFGVRLLTEFLEKMGRS